MHVYHVVLSPCIKDMVVNGRVHKQKNIPSWYMQFQFTMLVLLVQNYTIVINIILNVQQKSKTKNPQSYVSTAQVRVV